MNKNLEPMRIESLAPVKTELSSFLKQPNHGVGIFEREGWFPRQKEVRTITFRRFTGNSSPITFNLEWIGNNGTFSCPETITLPLNQPVDLPITITPKKPGVHSAILNIKYTDYPVIVHQVLNTVVVAERFTNTNNFSWEKRESVEQPGTESFFFYIPPRTPNNFQLDLEIPNKLKVRISLHPPIGYQIGSFEQVKDGSWSKTIHNPTPGVWEILIGNNEFAFEFDEKNPKPLTPTPIILKAKLVSADANPSIWEIRKSEEGGPFTQTFTFTNKLAQFKGKAGTAALGSAFASHPNLRDEEHQVFDIDVPPGSQMLSIRINQASDPNADLDLYLFEVVGGIAILREKSNGMSAEEAVMVESPNGGQWKVVVDAFKILSGSTEYSYQDLFTHTLFGMVSTDDPEGFRADNATWTAKVSVHVLAIPVFGRFLSGFVPIISLPAKREPSKEKEKGDEKQTPTIIGSVKIQFK